MHLQNANDEFGKSVERDGHTRAFRLINGEIDKEFAHATSEDNIYDWICTRYRESRGAELPGTVNPTVLERLFRQQSAQWEPIAKGHIIQVEQIINAFNRALLQDLIPEDSLRTKIKARNATFSNSVHTAAAIQLDQILLDERGGILQTINHCFADTLANTREERVVTRLKNLSLEDGGTNEEQAVNDIHDIFKAYYKVAMKRFMDNVVVQAVERHYLGSEGAVKAISPEYVGTLSDRDLSDIVAKSYATSSTRNEVCPQT